MINRYKFILLAVIFFSASQSKASIQDTLQLNIGEADSIFLKQNLLLIAAQLNVDANKALIIQAKSYPNPQISIGLDAYDSQNKTAFFIGPDGEKSYQFDQLILIGGKRRAQIDLAKKNSQMAEQQFSDLLRNLQFQLHQSFYELNRTYNVLPIYNKQLELLDELITSHEVQAQKGNVPYKDVIRLKTAYLNLNNDRSDLLKQQLEQIKNLRTLLRSNQTFIPVSDDVEAGKYKQIVSVSDLIKKALDNRPDVQLASSQADYASINLRLQKRNAIPDLSFTTSYDQRGNAFPNQYLVGVGMPLPLWDRNRGNIKAAGFQSQATDSLFAQKKMEVEGEVISAIENLNRSVQEYNKSIELYTADFEIVFKGESDNYRKGNISLLEFLDFVESYNQSIAEFERMKRDLFFAGEQINYVTASKLY